MKKKIINQIEIVLIIVLVFSIYKIFSYYKNEKDFKDAMSEYDDNASASKERIVSLVQDKEEQGESAEMTIPEKLKADFRKKVPDNSEKSDSKIEKSPKDFINDLAREYNNIVGRIIVDGTEIDFPIVQGEDNYFYLDHDYKNSYNIFGAVFMDFRNTKDFSDFNTVLYGHNVESGHIFHELAKLKEDDFVKAHPYIVVDTPDERKIYEIAAVYTAGAYEDYRSPSYDEKNFGELLNRVAQKNLIDKNTLEGECNMLTLSTCSDIDDRLVVHAVCIK